MRGNNQKMECQVGKNLSSSNQAVQSIGTISLHSWIPNNPDSVSADRGFEALVLAPWGRLLSDGKDTVVHRAQWDSKGSNFSAASPDTRIFKSVSWGLSRQQFGSLGCSAEWEPQENKVCENFALILNKYCKWNFWKMSRNTLWINIFCKYESWQKK